MTNFLLLLDVLKYGIFIIIFLGLTASLLSPFVIINDQSLVADGLSHVSFMALAVGFFFSDEPFYIALIIVVLASVFIKWLAKKEGIKGDVSLGIVSSLGIALGFIVLKFSNLWLQKESDVWLSLIILVVSFIFIITFYRKLLSVSFDYEYAKFKGINAKLFDYLFAVLIGLFVVVGVRSVGILLISSLLIFPSVIANIFSKSFKDLFFIGSLVTLVTVLSGIFIAHLLDFPTGSVIVIIYVIILFIMSMIKKIIKGATND